MNKKNLRKLVTLNITGSLCFYSFIAMLVYFIRPPIVTTTPFMSYLYTINGILHCICCSTLIMGVMYIKSGNVSIHRKLMNLSLAITVLLLLSYALCCFFFNPNTFFNEGFTIYTCLLIPPYCCKYYYFTFYYFGLSVSTL